MVFIMLSLLRRVVCSSVVIGCCWAIPFTSFASTDHIDKIVAIVNDQIISQSELDSEINGLNEQQQASGATTLTPEALKKRALDNLIAKSLQIQAAKMIGFTLAAGKIDEAIETIAAQHGISVSQLPDALKHQGMDFDVFKKQIAAQLLVQGLQQRQLAGGLKIAPWQIDNLAKKIAADPAKYQKTNDNGTTYHLYDVLIPLPANATPEQMAAAKSIFDAIGSQITAGKSLADAIAASGMTTSVQATDLAWKTRAQ